MPFPNTSDDADSKDKPQKKSLRETIYTSTPVVLTVIATVLAGMSSSEMTRAQYFRAMAAQNQSKATDQWSYYQAKRMRAANAQNTLDLLSASAHPVKLDATGLQPTAQDFPELRTVLSDPSTQIAFDPLEKQVPAISEKPITDPHILQAIKDVEQLRTETEMTPLLRQIPNEAMQQAFAVADGNMQTFNQLSKPAGAALDKLYAIVSRLAMTASESSRGANPTSAPTAGAAPSTATAPSVSAAKKIEEAQTDLAAARLRYAAVRYEREAQYNQVIGQLYEVDVRRASVSSERNRNRSLQLFYGMLAAQMGVVISSLSLAVTRRNIFWTLAALAGVAAIAFSGYIYLFT